MFRRENPFGGAPLLFFAPRRCDFLQERQVDSLSLPRFARELELAPYYFVVFIVYRVQLLPCKTYPNASRLVASLSSRLSPVLLKDENPTRCLHPIIGQYRGQTFAHARVVARAEVSARTKTEDKYTSGRLHEALEKKGK